MRNCNISKSRYSEYFGPYWTLKGVLKLVCIKEPKEQEITYQVTHTHITCTGTNLSWAGGCSPCIWSAAGRSGWPGRWSLVCTLRGRSWTDSARSASTCCVSWIAETSTENNVSEKVNDVNINPRHSRSIQKTNNQNNSLLRQALYFLSFWSFLTD